MLLVSEQAGDDFKAAAVTPLLPGAPSTPSTPWSRGRPPIGDGSGLAAAPDAVVKAFAASVKYPDPVATDLLAADPLSAQLRKGATDQSASLGAQGVFTQTHTPGGVLGGFRLKDGMGAIVFASLVRDDTIAMRSQVKPHPRQGLHRPHRCQDHHTEAKLTSNEILALVIPDTGKARIVAASDQLVDGSGR